MWTLRFGRTKPEIDTTSGCRNEGRTNDQLCLVTVRLNRCYFLWFSHFEDRKHMSTEGSMTRDVPLFTSLTSPHSFCGHKSHIKSDASQGGGLNPTSTSTSPFTQSLKKTEMTVFYAYISNVRSKPPPLAIRLSSISLIRFGMTIHGASRSFSPAAQSQTSGGVPYRLVPAPSCRIVSNVSLPNFTLITQTCSTLTISLSTPALHPSQARSEDECFSHCKTIEGAEVLASFLRKTFATTLAGTGECLCTGRTDLMLNFHVGDKVLHSLQS